MTLDELVPLFNPEPFEATEEWHKNWAAVGVVFRQNAQGQEELLFIERAERADDAWSGHMSFPGGRREAGETFVETAARECQEEVGLELIKGAKLLGYLPPVRAYKHGQPQNFSLIPVGFHLTQDQKLILDPLEVASTCWISTHWLFDQSNHSFFDYDHSLGKVQLPCIHLKSNKIWGLTYKVLDILQSRAHSQT